ncbi:phosphodiesterase [Streptomyces glaucescens]|uniref:Phosphodiesterase n=1 Tax=Streptomyces glaucescens TaxID=1907 RepID=A0A089XFM1_STRGA|nr:phosphodiesterase [Streptomyces glaucescens]AIS02099.1 hypothetical protein SGLAU_30825 [Streptomyces glaucescens]
MTGQPVRAPRRTVRTEAAYALARRIAERRAAPALHPAGVMCDGTLEVPGTGDGRWRVPWLDRPGSYAVTVRWSRALGLPGRLPDGLGLALRVEDADGAGAPLDLLLTSSRAGRLGRHLPLLRRDALAGPYSTLVAYRAGHRSRVLAAFPERGEHGPTGVSLPDLRQALARAPLRFDLRAAAPGEPWRSFAALTLTSAAHPVPESGTVSYDPYLHCLPELRPTAWLSALREAAYRGSRAGRGGRAPGRPNPPGAGTGE